MWVDVFEEAPQRREARLVSVPAGMLGEPVRIDVDFVDDVARVALFRRAPSVQLRPFMVSGGGLADEVPKDVVIMRGHERDAENDCRHGTSMMPKWQ
jgi:hypothetical protein